MPQQKQSSRNNRVSRRMRGGEFKDDFTSNVKNIAGITDDSERDSEIKNLWSKVEEFVNTKVAEKETELAAVKEELAKKDDEIKKLNEDLNTANTPSSSLPKFYLVQGENLKKAGTTTDETLSSGCNYLVKDNGTKAYKINKEGESIEEYSTTDASQQFVGGKKKSSAKKALKRK